ncbi:uncharacterized protein LOC131696238 [Topomyia yanbarensis]|uniref:uncharacterized protein LOC131696048 n=1 Tax=Topomyia yanbarensis TaxID=2498891 RepID=UPI00273B1DFC|nr:uncharacterized protein LOC131696048 [Topomyia yanbarensis]XP_058840556.1 uncharacterized protein LOC131696048 [Topomyia yanbarensis]XP_058840557.1 uncharacterized protein LOC131696048 [Topomyia yanbarensis]XP_058840770.1 uncharacterized protein LOC131696238 [Topomyia yanbarensis]XP_058840772.1 uncharacterized protein LOC131696238 [Topomyia yanbarensis]XP_058840773.1 uncharacterized protein LOC131696238 [Topomyia yanbarensis]
MKSLMIIGLGMCLMAVTVTAQAGGSNVLSFLQTEITTLTTTINSLVSQINAALSGGISNANRALSTGLANARNALQNAQTILTSIVGNGLTQFSTGLSTTLNTQTAQLLTDLGYLNGNLTQVLVAGNSASMDLIYNLGNATANLNAATANVASHVNSLLGNLLNTAYIMFR